jgi:hypothetical protein
MANYKKMNSSVHILYGHAPVHLLRWMILIDLQIVFIIIFFYIKDKIIENHDPGNKYFEFFYSS